MSRISRRSLLGGALGLAAVSTVPRAVRAGTCGPALCLPARPLDAPTGTSFAAHVTGLSDAQRYAAAVDQVLAGNVPAFLRPLSPVLMGGGRRPQVTLFVTPDYVSVGHRRDFLRVPLDLPGAARLAHRLDLALPTPAIVDAVYRSATTILAPAPMPPTSRMRSMPYVLQHQGLVEEARAGQPIVPLIAGHKKDVVLTNRLFDQPDRVAIYGWHRLSGRPIQPLSLVHGRGYADYSHGIRLVHRMVLVDGRAWDYFDALADLRVGAVLTREGHISGAQRLLRMG